MRFNVKVSSVEQTNSGKWHVGLTGLDSVVEGVLDGGILYETEPDFEVGDVVKVEFTVVTVGD